MNEVSEAPTVAYPDCSPEVPQQNGPEGSSAQWEQSAVPAAASRRSSVAPSEFYSDTAQANLVLWLDYTDEATSYHTLDMSMWGAVKYRRTFLAVSCNIVQFVAIDHKHDHNCDSFGEKLLH